MCKNFRLCLCCAILWAAVTDAFGDARCPADLAPLRYDTLPNSHLAVPVMLNGQGPFEFMVDTGAEITLIQPSLARELNLEQDGSLTLYTVTQTVDAPLVVARALAVGPYTAEGVRMAVESLGTFSAYSRVRGILGNSFLSRFDFLIDRRKKVLCLDNSRRMQQSLHGEHIPMLPGPPDADPVVLLRVLLPDDGPSGSVLVLDSGSNIPLLFMNREGRAETRRAPDPVQGHTIGTGEDFHYSYTPSRKVKLSVHREMEIAFAVPANGGRLCPNRGEDGVLPTTLFKRVFISAADRFVMFDPR